RPGNSALGLGSASPRMAKRSTGSAAWVRAGVKVLAASSRGGSRVRRSIVVPWSGGGWCLVGGAHRVRSRPVVFDVPGGVEIRLDRVCWLYPQVAEVELGTPGPGRDEHQLVHVLSAADHSA